MESEIEEECVEVAAFISKTNSEFLRAAAALNNDPGSWNFVGCPGNSQAVSGQILVKEGREGGKAYGKRYGVGVGPKWEVWKIFGLEGHTAPNGKVQRIVLGIQETGTPRSSPAPSGRK